MLTKTNDNNNNKKRDQGANLSTIFMRTAVQAVSIVFEYVLNNALSC